MAKKIKNTKSLRNKLAPFCDEYDSLRDEFYKNLADIELRMENATGIDGVEFFFGDGEHVGVGNFEKTMPLIFFEDINREGD